MLQNRKNIIIAVVLILVVLIAVWAIKTNKDEGYSVVYLSTGEIYVGKLTTFPDLQLKDSYILLVTKDVEDPTKNNFQLNPIKDALWAPRTLHLVKDNVVFYGPLLSDSVIAKKLAEQGK